MALIEFNWSPTTRQLRQFGVICLFALPLLGWLWNANTQQIGILAVLGLLLAALGMLAPAVIKPVFIGLMLIAAPIGMILGEFAMLFIYYGIFLPIGLMFRVLGRDALRIARPQHVETYWRPVRKPDDIGSYYRQS